jgi:mono/diheme cytochrome c family protein
MKHTTLRWWALWVALPGLVSCTAPGGPGSEPLTPASTGDAADRVSSTASALCLPAAAESLPGRTIEAAGDEATPTAVERKVFVTDLFARFRGLCGACHVDNNIGMFHADIGSFPDIDRMKVMAALTSDDGTKYMPPPNAFGKPWSMRDHGDLDDPVVRLVTELQQWFDQNAPHDVFTVKVTQTAATESYAMSEEMAQRQTNLGNCVPGRGMVATKEADMDELDARFLAAPTLPDRLDQTDLTTLDSAELARKGVIAFAPAYPLWSEDSGKMRAIRVPHGTSVKFDKASQRFDIPENTRFYKTFLKKITLRDGRTVWRKIETRLIVTRADTQESGAPAVQNALFGTYAWNDDETEALLVKDALRNGEPFADRMFTYVVDQPRYDKLVQSNPRDLQAALAKEENKGIARHYAIPGKQRCLECHMGSPSQDFVLGFTPLQIRRRPRGEAGVYEDAGPDEVNQLQRLIDYGVITGVSSPSDIRGLEEPQGPRTTEKPQGSRPPRNQSELLAQAYLLGNCSHCHNPRGFPSIKSPDLAPLLNFLPSDLGGVFQFPLDRVSPLRRRGVKQDITIPYLTPSLRDYPAVDPADAHSVGLYKGGLWTPKWMDCLKGIWGMAFCDLFNRDDVRFIAAPWRSLVYRNVDTPYIYADDFTVFPHMPRHSAGFDCRAPRIMGDWMVSIPALHKNEGAEYEDNTRLGPYDTNPQPYEEVKPGEPNYLLALSEVAERLNEFHQGKRYGYCPDRSDIVMPEALTTTDPRKLTPPDAIQYADASMKLVVMPPDGVPDRAHWIPSDLTEVPGTWSPRRDDWKDHVVDPTPKAADESPIVVKVPFTLRGLRVTNEMRAYATREIPFGVWQHKAGCDFSGVPRAQDSMFQGSSRPRWMAKNRGNPAPDAPVYMITPGGAVFSNICVNCHGPQADSRGLLAEAISEMTGGAARVANLRDGLLGPPDSPGSNIMRVFDPKTVNSKSESLTDLDWAARYLSWMALGGTQRAIPNSLLKIVGASLVMGMPRDRGGVTFEASANMLELARRSCMEVLAWENGTDFNKYFNGGDPSWSENTNLLDKIGDADMWRRLCSVGNRPVVRVPVFDGSTWVLDWRRSFLWGEDYGRGPIMNERGGIDDGIQVDNLMPTCVSADDFDLAPESSRLRTPDGRLAPRCPPAFLEEVQDQFGTRSRKRAMQVVFDSASMTYFFVGRDEWAVRGAANAGISVLLYLREVRNGTIKPKPAYDRCEQLKR